MLPKSIETALNNQIQAEFYASHLYLAMAAYFHERNLHGFAHWMKLQASEERGHAMKIFDYVIDRGGIVVLKEIKSPPVKYASVLDVMEKALAHEQKVTASINSLYEAAQKAKDHPTTVMLQWFITEQVEEESQAEELVEKLKLISEKSSAILYLDKELKKRGGE